MKVLIAEDDRVLSQLLAGRLLDEGVETFVALDAMQAVMQVMRVLPDVVLLDINMPGGSGLEVLKRLKASSKTRIIPIIAFSSTSDPELGNKLKALGAAEFLPKPFQFEQLQSVIQRVLRKQPAASGIERGLPP